MLKATSLAAAAVLIIAGALATLAPAADEAGHPIALVNQTPVLRQDLDREIKLVALRLTLQGQHLDPEDLQRYEGQFRETLINRVLLLVQAQAMDIDVADALVVSALEAFKAGFQNRQDYTRTLTQLGLTEEALIVQIKNGLIIQNLIEKEVTDTISVSERQARSFYDQNPNLFRQPEQVKASHILVQNPEGAEEAKTAQAWAAVNALKQRIDNGENFATLAMDHSDCPSKAQGGDLGFFGRQDMVEPFAEAAFALEPGQVSDVVTTRFGYHLIRVTERQAEQSMSFNDAKDAIVAHLRQEQEEQKVAAYIEKLKETADIKRFPM